MNDTPQKRPAGPPPPIPVIVLTGFLGAGKTTLLNRLLPDPALADTAVLINEFGEIGLDHLFVGALTDGVVMLSSGCVCCAIRGELVSALEDLLRGLDNGRIPPFRRVVLETTGLADPAPILQTLIAHPYLRLRYRLGAVVTLVDAVNGLGTLDAHAEAVKQVAVADRIVVSKTDIVAAEAGRALDERLRRLAPGAPILRAQEADPETLLAAGLADPASRSPDIAGWLAAEAELDARPLGAPHTHHDDGVRSFSLSTDAAIASGTLDMFLDLVRSLHGPRLLRFKGIVKLADDPRRPVVLHGVQYLLHPPVRLDDWPDGDQRTRLVFITRGVEPGEIQRLFDAFLGIPAPDRPDAAALVDNPLVPFGGSRP